MIKRNGGALPHKAPMQLSCKRFALYLSIFIATLGGVSFGQAPDPLLQQAEEALKKNDYSTAAQALESYVAKIPNDYRAEFNLGYVYSLLGKRGEAIQHYQRVLTQEPGIVEAHLNLGILLAETGKPSEAEIHLRETIGKQPDNANASFWLAESLAAMKRGPEAIEFYERTLKLKPDQPRAHLGIGRALEASNPQIAEEHYRKAAALEPSLEEASLRLAVLLEAGAEGANEPLAEASRIYREILVKHPDRRDLRVRLGEDLVAQKQYSDAVEQFEMARSSGDDSIGLARALVKAYLNLPAPDSQKSDTQKSTEKVLALLREIQEKDSGDADSRMLAGRLRMERKEYGAAASDFAQAAKLQAEPAEAYRNLSSAFFLMGDYPSALGALARIADLKQDTAGTYFLRAVCLDKLHVVKEALENYQKFLSLSHGKSPDQEFQARQRSHILTLDIQKGMGGKRR